MPGEDLTHGPPANEKAGGSHHRSGRSTGIPCAMGLTFIRDLPGVRLIATVVSGIIITHRLGASFGAPGPRDFTSATCRSPARCESTLRQDRGHRIPSSTFVTIAKRPSHEDGMAAVFPIFGNNASGKFLQTRWLEAGHWVGYRIECFSELGLACSADPP